MELFDSWREVFFGHVHELQNKNPDQASELLKQFLALNPLNEPTFQSYLKCLAAIGQHDSKRLIRHLQGDLKLNWGSSLQKKPQLY